MDMNKLGNNDRLANLNGYQIAGGAIGFSLLVALGTIGVTQLIRWKRLRPIAQRAARIPDGPAIETAIPPSVPEHFTEQLIIPGFTETGADVEREDESDGRSPQGA